jgi:hypothetical protein
MKRAFIAILEQFLIEFEPERANAKNRDFLPLSREKLPPLPIREIERRRRSQKIRSRVCG